MFSEHVYCHNCYYDLCATDGRCTECGLMFQRSDPASYSRYPFPRWRVMVLKVLAACDQWWFYLAGVIGFTVGAVLVSMLWARI